MSKTSEWTSTAAAAASATTNNPRRTTPARFARPALPIFAAAAASLAAAGRADAGVNWWLPANYSKHGVDMDHLFTLVFVITMIVMVAVFAVMLYFLIKYRYNPDRKKAHFSHGNTKLEMAWTILPAIILAVISLYSKGVWDRYRHGDPRDTEKPARLLVIGQQFQWNVVYAGADGKLGRYLVYPKPGDKLWPRGADGEPFTFTFGKYEDTKGPADMPYDDALAAINAYIDQENPLGKDYVDPNGKDDNFDPQPGRPVFVPKGRPVEVQLSSKDVIHSFFLPNFRVKLDAVPGLRGQVHFVPTTTSKELENLPENRRAFANLDELRELVKSPVNRNLIPVINDKSLPKAPDAKSPGAFFDTKARQWKYNDATGQTIIREGLPLTPSRVDAMKAIGVKEVQTYRAGYFDIVCEELCGQGHGQMQGQLIVVSPEEYAEQFEAAPEEAAAPPDQTKTVSRR